MGWWKHPEKWEVHPTTWNILATSPSLEPTPRQGGSDTHLPSWSWVRGPPLIPTQKSGAVIGRRENGYQRPSKYSPDGLSSRSLHLVSMSPTHLKVSFFYTSWIRGKWFWTSEGLGMWGENQEPMGRFWSETSSSQSPIFPCGGMMFPLVPLVPRFYCSEFASNIDKGDTHSWVGSWNF